MKYNQFDAAMKQTELRLMTDAEVEATIKSTNTMVDFYNHCAKIVPFVPMLQAEKWFKTLSLDPNASIRKGTYLTDTEARNIASFFKHQ